MLKIKYNILLRLYLFLLLKNSNSLSSFIILMSCLYYFKWSDKKIELLASLVLKKKKNIILFLTFLVDDCILMYLEITILCIYNFLILYGYLFGFFFLYTLAPICLKSWVRPWNRLTYREQYKSCTWDQAIQIGILSHKMSVDSIT